MTAAAIAGFVVLGIACAASLGLMGAGALSVLRAQNALQRTQARIEQTQQLRFDPARFAALSARFSRDATQAQALIGRAQRALTTICAPVRFAMLALRLRKLVR